MVMHCSTTLSCRINRNVASEEGGQAREEGGDSALVSTSLRGFFQGHVFQGHASLVRGQRQHVV